MPTRSARKKNKHASPLQSLGLGHANKENSPGPATTPLRKSTARKPKTSAQRRRSSAVTSRKVLFETDEDVPPAKELSPTKKATATTTATATAEPASPYSAGMAAYTRKLAGALSSPKPAAHGRPLEGRRGLLALAAVAGAALMAAVFANGGGLTAEQHRALTETAASLQDAIVPFGTRVRVLGPNPYTMAQGEAYDEHGVSVPRSTAERPVSLDVEYSAPLSGKYVSDVGTHFVTYAVSAPHLPDGKQIVRRSVVVADVNECTYDGPVAAFRHACGSRARCRNTVGAYECV